MNNISDISGCANWSKNTSFLNNPPCLSGACTVPAPEIAKTVPVEEEVCTRSYTFRNHILNGPTFFQSLAARYQVAIYFKNIYEHGFIWKRCSGEFSVTGKRRNVEAFEKAFLGTRAN